MKKICLYVYAEIILFFAKIFLFIEIFVFSYLINVLPEGNFCRFLFECV